MALKVNNLRVEIEGKEILKGVSLEIQPGEVVALMGPNGSGKSTLAYTLAGHPNYSVVAKSEVSLDGADMVSKTPDERAREGLFLAFQYPVAIGGVNVRDLLLAALRARTGTKIAALDLRKEIEAEAEELKMSPDLLKRDLNQGFSGGEKKKMEVLQMRIMKPKYAILDETDSGLDIDALRTVAEGARFVADKNKTGILVITHYQRILKHLKPDRILVMKDGLIVDQGGPELVKRLEEVGYKDYE